MTAVEMFEPLFGEWETSGTFEIAEGILDFHVTAVEVRGIHDTAG